MSLPRTSIVIPTHNRAAMVTVAIDSALALPGAERREVVVVNDGSTDNTREVLAGYGDRIRVLNSKHGERSRARNAGIEAATGEFLCFLDDDDLFLPDGFPQLEAALAEASPTVGVVYGRPQYVRTGPQNPMQGNLTPNLDTSGEVLPTLLRGNFIVMGNVLVRRALVQELGGFSAECVPIEDFDLWLRVAARARIEFRDVEVAEIRLHGANSTADTTLAGRVTDRVIERNLLSHGLTEFVERQAPELRAAARRELAALCLDLARRRWWEGETAISRQAQLQALRLSPGSAAPGLARLWRAWLPTLRRGLSAG